MSKNSGIANRRVLQHIDAILSVDAELPHGVCGRAVYLIKEARKTILRDVRRRRDGREREAFKRTKAETGESE